MQEREEPGKKIRYGKRGRERKGSRGGEEFIMGREQIGETCTYEEGEGNRFREQEE